MAFADYFFGTYTCSCGGAMERLPLPDPKKEPHAYLARCLTPPHFRCTACNKTERFYSTVWRNIYHEEPLT